LFRFQGRPFESPAGEGWFHEIKYDGYRMHARIDGGDIKLAHPHRPRLVASHHRALAGWTRTELLFCLKAIGVVTKIKALIRSGRSVVAQIRLTTSQCAAGKVVGPASSGA